MVYHEQTLKPTQHGGATQPMKGADGGCSSWAENKGDVMFVPCRRDPAMSLVLQTEMSTVSLVLTLRAW